MDLQLTVTITADELLMSINIDDFERPWTFKIKNFYCRFVLRFSAAAHTSIVNCDEMDGERPGKPANRNCYLGCRASHGLCSHYLSSANIVLYQIVSYRKYWRHSARTWFLSRRAVPSDALARQPGSRGRPTSRCSCLCRRRFSEREPRTPARTCHHRERGRTAHEPQGGRGKNYNHRR